MTCPDRVTVLPNYRVRVRLLEQRTGETIASKEEDFSGFPWFFELEYDAKLLRRGGLHCLAAEVLAGGETLYRTDTQYRLPEGGKADLVVTRVSAP